jgi:hypothetical protein
MSQTPFEIMRWDDAATPTLERLMRMLEREGLKPEQAELPSPSHSPEMKFDRSVVRVLVNGKVQYSFPGYGVIELEPGDVLEINPGVLHDVIVAGSQPAILLEADRPS